MMIPKIYHTWMGGGLVLDVLDMTLSYVWVASVRTKLSVGLND